MTATHGRRINSAVSVSVLNFLLPGDPNTRTGGYIYDARIAAGLRDLGWVVNVQSLHNSFPAPDGVALAHAAQRFDALADHALVLVDGLAFGAMPDLAEQHGKRLCLLALVHHPLAAETGLSAQRAQALAVSEQKALAATEHVIVTSTRTAQDLIEHYNVPAGKLSVVVPGTDAVPAAQVESSQGRQVTRLLSVASVTPRKGYDVLINALAPLAGQRWQLRCAGSLDYAADTVAQLRNAIEQNGLGKQVQLLGELDDDELRDCYQWADAFVSPTRLEGYGMALADAIAWGLPVVTTAGGAAADTVGDQAALLVPPEDVDALSSALQRLLREPDLYAQLARGARARAQQLPSWNDSAQAMHQVLNTVNF